jgi:serine protease Do
MGTPFGRPHEFDPSNSDKARGGRLERLVSSKGTGFFISPDGYVVTNHHVVASSRTVEVSTVDGMNYKAQVVASDPSSDIALLKVDGRSDFPFIKFADKAPRIGDQVFAVGNPFGLGGTVTAGIVSGLGRNIGSHSYDGLIQIDAPINKGNSGGPSFDLAGDVIGVNTIIFSPSGGSIGIGFAIPADTVRNVVFQLKETHAVSRGWLGAELQPVTSGIAEAIGLKQPLGAIVAETKPGGPAADGGILVGDVIASLNGDAVKDSFELSHRLAAIAPGELVDLGVMRDGTEQTFAVTLGKAPAPQLTGEVAVTAEPTKPPGSATDLGLVMTPAAEAPVSNTADAPTEKKGVVVLGIHPTGRAARLGIDRGDVILDVGGQAVQTPEEVRKALEDAHNAGRPATLMRLKSAETIRFVAVPFDPA